MSSIPTSYCGFPEKFPAYDEKYSIRYYINKLWENKDWKLVIPPYWGTTMRIEGVQVGTDHVSTSGFKLPSKLPFISEAKGLINYLQELLNLNGHSDTIVVLDKYQSKFRILTKTAFLESLEHPITEYRYDDTTILHYGIDYPYICMYVSEGIAQKYFFENK